SVTPGVPSVAAPATNATNDPALTPGNTSRTGCSAVNAVEAITATRFSTPSTHTTPRPIGIATPRKTTPSAAPKPAHINKIRAPAATPRVTSPALPQANDAPSIAAITVELTALNASMAATPTSTPTTMASHCPASTAILPGRWISWVLTVSQPNSLPVIRAPNTRARAPANTGNPLIVEPTAWSGSMAGNKSLAVPPTGGVSPLRNAKYGIR